MTKHNENVETPSGDWTVTFWDKTKHIEIIECPSGDWTVTLADGVELTTGHSISIWDVITLLEHCGATVTRREISDEAMQDGRYAPE